MIMRSTTWLPFSFVLLLAGCGGGIKLDSPSSGYFAKLIDSSLIWDENTRTLTFSFYCVPPPDVTIVSLEGDFNGPTNGKLNITYNSGTGIGQGMAMLPFDGKYVINIYANDSLGRKVLVLRFTSDISGSGGGSGGGGGGSDSDTPPLPPF